MNEMDGPLAERVRWAENGLVPAVVQDRRDGCVLMVAYMDAVALAATLETGEVHFHSRSRGRLWRKGETSGNVLRLLDVALDCDGDALLVTVDPAGPTCHRGTRSCFDTEAAEGGTTAAEGGTTAAEGGTTAADDGTSAAVPPSHGFVWLETLWATIEARADADPAGSYTARLLAKGVDGPSRKVAEEATEVLMAAKDDATAGPETAAARHEALTGEVADLLYHTLVLLKERAVDPADVIAVLRSRHRQ